MKFKRGDTVLFIQHNRAPLETKVKSVGAKWVTVEKYTKARFHVDTGQMENYGQNCLTTQDVIDTKARLRELENTLHRMGVTVRLDPVRRNEVTLRAMIDVLTPLIGEPK